MKVRNAATKKTKYPYFVYIDSSFKHTDKKDQLANYFLFAHDIKNAFQLAIRKAFDDGVVGHFGGRDMHQFDDAALQGKTASNLAPGCVTLTFYINDHDTGHAELFEPEEQGAYVELDAFSPASMEFWEHFEMEDSCLADLVEWAEKNLAAAILIREQIKGAEDLKALLEDENAAVFFAKIEAMEINAVMPENATAKKSSPTLSL